MTQTQRISVIVPALNEEHRLEAQLDALRRQGFHEIVVVDGGSTDRTRKVAQAKPGIRLLTAPRGRARQMNAGAAEAAGDVLLFLHADVRLPPNASALIQQALVQDDVVAGAFRTWTVCDDPTAPRRWLGPLLHLADLRSRWTTLPYGDQAIFVRAAPFHHIGGYPDIPLMEDLALSQRLRELGRITRANGRVQVSGRRFLEHPITATTLVNVFPTLYRLGVPPTLLARIYRHVR